MLSRGQTCIGVLVLDNGAPIVKPLPADPLTFDDLDIWKRVITVFRPISLAPVRVSRAAFDADRRDAALMLKFSRTRVGHIGDHLVRATYGLEYWDIEAIAVEWIG